MKWSATGYDLLAPVYDRLAVFFVGKEIREAQVHFLTHLKDKRKLLILGGGTGWILEEIEKINRDIQVRYIDQSPRMVKLAKSRKGDLNIQFTIGTEADINDTDYDCVITNFYLDLFTDTQLTSVSEKIKSCLKSGALWLATDFYVLNLRQRLAVRCMYFLFRIVTGLTTTRLPDWQQVLNNIGGREIFSRQWSRGYIVATVFSF